MHVCKCTLKSNERYLFERKDTVAAAEQLNQSFFFFLYLPYDDDSRREATYSRARPALGPWLVPTRGGKPPRSTEAAC